MGIALAALLGQIGLPGADRGGGAGTRPDSPRAAEAEPAGCHDSPAL